MIEYLENRQTVTGDYYLSFLIKLGSKLVSQQRGKLIIGVLLLPDNVLAHRAQQAVQTAEQCRFEILHTQLIHQTFLFPNLKKSHSKDVI